MFLVTGSDGCLWGGGTCVKRRKEREKKIEAQEKERKRQEGSEEGVGKRNKESRRKT